MADLSGFSGSGFEANAGGGKESKGVDAELEGFLMMEKQKAQLTAQVLFIQCFSLKTIRR